MPDPIETMLYIFNTLHKASSSIHPSIHLTLTPGSTDQGCRCPIPLAWWFLQPKPALWRHSHEHISKPCSPSLPLKDQGAFSSSPKPRHCDCPCPWVPQSPHPSLLLGLLPHQFLGTSLDMMSSPWCHTSEILVGPWWIRSKTAHFRARRLPKKALCEVPNFSPVMIRGHFPRLLRISRKCWAAKACACFCAQPALCPVPTKARSSP